MVKVGEKYIIEIAQEFDADMSFIYKDSLGKVPRKLYRVVGFNSLVFDEDGLSKLQKIEDSVDSKFYNEGYEKGLQDAWEAAKRIYGFNKDTCLLTTAFNYPENAIDTLEARDAINAVIKYDNAIENLKVGDVVKWGDKKYIILKLNKKRGDAKLLEENTYETTLCGYAGALTKISDGSSAKIVEFFDG